MMLHETKLHREKLTVRVIRIDIRPGYIPTLERTIETTAETLFTCSTHGQAQHRPNVTSERVDGLHIQRG